MAKDDVEHENNQNTHVNDLSDVVDNVFVGQSINEKDKKRQEKDCQYFSVELKGAKPWDYDELHCDKIANHVPWHIGFLATFKTK